MPPFIPSSKTGVPHPRPGLMRCQGHHRGADPGGREVQSRRHSRRLALPGGNLSRKFHSRSTCLQVLSGGWRWAQTEEVIEPCYGSAVRVAWTTSLRNL